MYVCECNICDEFILYIYLKNSFFKKKKLCDNYIFFIIYILYILTLMCSIILHVTSLLIFFFFNFEILKLLLNLIELCTYEIFKFIDNCEEVFFFLFPLLYEVKDIKYKLYIIN